MLRDWSSIPTDILMLVAESIHSIEDYVRFGAVCRSWNSAVTSLKTECDGVGGGRHCHSLNFSPWLMLAEKKDSDLRGFYSFSSKRVFEIDLPEIRGRRCWGSPFGWLVTFGVDMEIHLFNPFTKDRISLPPIRTFIDGQLINYPYVYSADNEDLRTGFIRKAILSSSPSSSSSDYIVMAIYSEFGKLGFFKAGDHFWSPIGTGNEMLHTSMERVHDVTYFNGSFFIAKASGELLICDMSASHPEALLFAEPPEGWLFGQREAQKYLVDLGGELCMVFRNVEDHKVNVAEKFCLTNYFVIYKLDMFTRKWEPIKSLGEWSFFVGANYTFSIRASDNPGISSNYIYYTDDLFDYEEYGGRDAGIYNYDNDEDDIYPLPTSQDLFSTFCPPLWIKLQF